MKRHRLAVFGGSFDPPHVGHLRIADAAVEEFHLDEIKWVPASVSPFKTEEAGTEAAHRLAMVERLTAGRREYSVSDVEVSRGGVSYTVDTLRSIKLAMPDIDLYFLLGEDAYETFDRWSEPDEIRRLARLIVYPRGIAPKKRRPTESRVRFLEGARIDISSSEIRHRIERGENVDDWVPESVMDYIRTNHLYAAD